MMQPEPSLLRGEGNRQEEGYPRSPALSMGLGNPPGSPLMAVMQCSGRTEVGRNTHTNSKLQPLFVVFIE